MDNILKQEMDNLKQDIGGIKEAVGELSEAVKDMSFALMGNKFTKNGGIINEMIQLKADNAALEKRVEILEKNEGKNDIYVKILWAVAGAVGLSVLYFVMNIIFKK